MQGDRARARWRIILMMSAVTTCIMIGVIGGSGSAARAATDGTLPCVTPTAIPTGTPTTGTPGPSPTALPPTATATAPQIIGRLLGDAPVTATASSTPLPICTPTPAPTKAPPTPSSTVQAIVHSSAIPVASMAATSAAMNVVSPVAIASATTAPSTVPVTVSVQSAPIPASVTALSSAPSSPLTSSSSSSAPPPAAVGLPPPPPPGYSVPVGNTPNSVGSGPVPAFPSVVGTPVVSAVRGNVASAGAPSLSFPSAPAARPVLPPGYAVGPTGTAIPVINPRAGHARAATHTGFAFLLGIVFMVVGAWLRGFVVIGGATFARDARTRYTTSALLRSVRNTREGYGEQ